MNASCSIDSSSRRKPGSSVVFGLCALALLFIAAASHAEVAVPPLHARVTDLTGTLSAQQRKQMDDELAALERRKGAQVVVLMLPTTQPETIEQYATRVFDQWKIGRKHVDDGVLVVVAKDDHRVFIETGYGLEGAIPDALASRIIRDYITPKFRGGDFYGGLHDGLGALEKLIDGEPLPPAQREGSGSADNGNFGGLLALGLFLAFFFRGVFGRLKTPLRAGANGLLIGAALFLLGGMLVGLGIAGFAIGALVGLLPGSGGAFARSGSWGRWGGGFGGWGGGGGFGGGGFGGGGFGGGGFGGGGGMTGGGGASGSW
ncbi:MAG TPA: YgcG family protein [Rhodanobacteraceae bacterium]